MDAIGFLRRAEQDLVLVLYQKCFLLGGAPIGRDVLCLHVQAGHPRGVQDVDRISLPYDLTAGVRHGLIIQYFAVLIKQNRLIFFGSLN